MSPPPPPYCTHAYYTSPALLTTLPPIHTLPIRLRFHPFPSLHFTALPFPSLPYTFYTMYQSRCTAQNSWWWAERPPETCRVVIPIKLEFSASVGFIHFNSLFNMHDMNIKINTHLFSKHPLTSWSWQCNFCHVADEFLLCMFAGCTFVYMIEPTKSETIRDFSLPSFCCATFYKNVFIQNLHVLRIFKGLMAQ
jgi:hypothetical protein